MRDSDLHDRNLVITENFYTNTRRHRITKGISRPCLYGDVINKAQKFKCHISKCVKSLNNRIRKGYDLATIFDSQSLRQILLGGNIDNLLVQLVGPTGN